MQLSINPANPGSSFINFEHCFIVISFIIFTIVSTVEYKWLDKIECNFTWGSLFATAIICRRSSESRAFNSALRVSIVEVDDWGFTSRGLVRLSRLHGVCINQWSITVNKFRIILNNYLKNKILKWFKDLKVSILKTSYISMKTWIHPVNQFITQVLHKISLNQQSYNSFTLLYSIGTVHSHRPSCRPLAASSSKIFCRVFT